MLPWFGRKANTVLRAKINGRDVSVIPNAVDMSMFKPIQRGEVGPPNDRGSHVLLSLNKTNSRLFKT